MTTTDDTTHNDASSDEHSTDAPQSTPSPGRPRGPVWVAVLRERLGFSRRRSLTRAGRITRLTVTGLGKLAVALLLVAAMRTAPLLRSWVGSSAWGVYASELTDRILGPKTYLGAAAALGLAYLASGLPAPFSVVLMGLLVTPALGVFSLPVCRFAYGHTAWGRVRRRFGVEGWADYWELRRGVSAHAVRHVAVSQRPSVAARLPEVPSRHHVGSVAVGAAKLRRHALIERLPVSQCGTWLGRSAVGPWWGVQAYAAYRDVVGLIAPPQTGKTALMIHHVIDHPGAVISTSTKPEIYLYTALLREALFGKGTAALFNPDNLGWLGSTLRWDPVRGCAEFRAAHARASLLVGARERNDNDDGRWDAWATEVLAGMLMVADLTGRNMHDVARWCHNEKDKNFGPAQALALMHGELAGRVPEGVADSLGQILGSDAKKTSASVFFALRGAVGFMSDPAVAALCTPGRDEPNFDVEAFLRKRGTLYLLGSEEQNATTAPLLAAFTGHVFETAKVVAARSGRKLGRLDPPLLISLDEAALITPVPLHKWVADAGGRGIHIVWSVQTPSQLADRWGEAGAKTILNATNALMIFGGLKQDDDLEQASTWCGKRLELVPDPDGDGPGHAKYERVPVCPPDMVRRIPQWHALLVYRMTETTLLRMWPAWQRPDVKAAGTPTGAPLPVPTGARPRSGADPAGTPAADAPADAAADTAPSVPPDPAPAAAPAASSGGWGPASSVADDGDPFRIPALPQQRPEPDEQPDPQEGTAA